MPDVPAHPCDPQGRSLEWLKNLWKVLQNPVQSKPSFTSLSLDGFLSIKALYLIILRVFYWYFSLYKIDLPYVVYCYNFEMLIWLFTLYIENETLKTTEINFVYWSTFQKRRRRRKKVYRVIMMLKHSRVQNIWLIHGDWILSQKH